jgi:hypothetical protein
MREHSCVIRSERPVEAFFVIWKQRRNMKDSPSRMCATFSCMEGLYARLYDPMKSRGPDVERSPDDEVVASKVARTSNSARALHSLIQTLVAVASHIIVGIGTTDDVLRALSFRPAV